MRTLFLTALTACLLSGQPKPIWSDEFSTPGLPDPSKWSYHTGGGGWGNQEQQYYTEKRTANAEVRDGRLVITAKREDHQGMRYTSARLITKGKAEWTYGWFEIRAKLPKGRGTWPALWMLASNWTEANWPGVGEIDIMEHVGFDPGRIHGSVHCSAYNHLNGTQKTGTVMVPDASDQFHVYGVNWTREGIEVFLDGKKYFSFENEKRGERSWPFYKPFYLLMNIAVGGGWGGRQGIDDSVFPQTMEVDYVRVFERKP